MKAFITCAIVSAALVAWASPAQAQACDPIRVGEGTIVPQICGFVWSDNGDGIQNDDADMDSTNGDQSGITDVTVTLFEWDSMTNEWSKVGEIQTDGGFYYFDGVDDGLYKVVVSVPTGKEPSPAGAGGDDTVDSDGVNDTDGSAAQVTIGSGGVASQDLDFGLSPNTKLSPGTGTPGYWKNHSWPVQSISIGGTTYTRAQAISYMGKVSKDKTITLFSSLLSAKLNALIGNEHGCIDARISEADTWLGSHLVGSGVPASSDAWQAIADAHEDLDDYNNGRLCAPHRN